MIYDSRPLQALLNERSQRFDQAFALKSAAPRFAYIPVFRVAGGGLFGVVAAGIEAVIWVLRHAYEFETEVAAARERVHRASVLVQMIDSRLISVERRIADLDERILFHRLNSSE